MMLDRKRRKPAAPEPHDITKEAVKTTPLRFFVHVPKTSGSSINAALLECNPNGLMHCEAIINDTDKLEEYANKADWLSGHIDLITAQEKLTVATTRAVEFYSCMRRPRKQVASHYNWLIEIFHKGPEFYNKHPERVQAISRKIRSSNNESVYEIIANLQQFAGLFLNFQSRFILGRRFNWNTGKIYQQIKKYQVLTNNNNSKEIAEKILGFEDFDFPKINESQYHFDPSLFESSIMMEFLQENNTLDEILYEIGPSRKDVSAS